VKSHGWAGIRPAGTVVLATAGEFRSAQAVISAGAGLIDLWDADTQTLAAFQAQYPDVPACAQAEWAALVHDRATALHTGAALICHDLDEARQAAASGIGRDGLLVEAPPAQAAELIAAGWQVIVGADEPSGQRAAGRGEVTAAAVAAVACWLGAAAVRTRHVTAARRAIDMTASIRGTRPIPGGYVRS
jgi:dihydropteroate synthase